MEWDRSEMKTYNGWIMEGLAVKIGEKARWYIVSPDGQHSKAVFERDQVGPNDEAVDASDWTTVVPVEERQTKRTPKAKVKIDYSPETAVMSIWCGTDKPMIAVLRKGKYRFHGPTHRWNAKRPDWRPLVAELQAWRPELKLEVRVDGVVQELEMVA